jgi:hypothetical protein
MLTPMETAEPVRPPAEPSLPQDIRSDLERARAAQARAVEYAHEAADLWRSLPLRLVQAGVPPVEVADILGVSVARVRQLLAS